MRRTVGAALVTALLSVVAPLWSSAPAVAAPVPVGTITANGLGIGHPYGIVAGPDGNIWFANYHAASIGRITPTGVITNFTGASMDNPRGITVGPDENLWFTLPAAIGRMTTAGEITQFPSDSIDDATDIVAGPDGNLWFTSTLNNTIGRITPAGVVTSFSAFASAPGSITAGPDGNLWFTSNNFIGRITTAGVVTTFGGDIVSGPTDITTGPDGNLWFTDFSGQSIGRISPSGDIASFTGEGISFPMGITAGPDGNLWVANHIGGTITRITPAGIVTVAGVVASGGPDTNLNMITAGQDGDLWFTSRGSRIGRITTDGELSQYAGTGIQGAHEIVTGPDGNIWYANHGGNSIGRISPSGQVTNFTDPAMSAPMTITVGPDGNLWFTNRTAPFGIGRITTSGATTHFASGTYAGDIATGSDGNLWFTSWDAIGRITPSGAVSRYGEGQVGIAGLITAGPDGNLWFTNHATNSIGRITPSGGLSFFSDASLSSPPEGLTAGPDGNVWWANYYGNTIGRITPTGVISNFADPGISNPLSIASGPDGALWFTNGKPWARTIGRITTDGFVSTFNGPMVNHPTYGIAAGPDGGVWFSNGGSSSIGRIQALGIPLPPTGPTAVAGNRSAVVSWSPPPADGGPPINYTVTASPGGATCVWSSGPRTCSVTGLTNGTTYTFTVTATNASGTSAPSAASNAVTPQLRVTSVTRNVGPTAGGNQVVIQGEGFTGTTSVVFGQAPAAQFTVVTDSVIVAVAPPWPVGLVNVWVKTPVSSSIKTTASLYRYSTIAVGSLSGSVSAGGGEALAGMLVLVALTDGSPAAYAITASDGTFAVANMVPGTYIAAVLDPAQLQGSPSYYVSQLYKNSGPLTGAQLSTATPITVASGPPTVLDPFVLAHT